MMRPTQSSAHKTAEKAPVTPPRKQNASVKKPENKDVEKNAKKVAAKIQASSTKGKTAKESVKSVVAKERPTAEEIAPAVAQAETAEAVIEKANLSIDTAEAPLIEEQKAEAEPSTKDVAAVVAQEETAEDIIETAKASQDITVPPVLSHAEASDGVPVAGPTMSLQVEVSDLEVIDKPEAAASIPVISEDPVKVEDIENVIQKADEPSHQPETQSTEPTAQVAQPEDSPEIIESHVASTEEPKADAEAAVDVPVEPVEPVPDVKEMIGEETKTDGHNSLHNPVDGAADDPIAGDQVAETTNGDAAAAAL
jgi:hypothetical protein